MNRPQQHERWMRLALELAEKGRATTSPNPIVGAVVIANGKLISKGWHPFYGGEHAEVIALRQAGRCAKNATLYVTLEPCSTWGKTPPCVDAILESGVREVVIATADPNPKHHLKGIAALKKAGVRVMTRVLEKEAARQNESFFKTIQTGLPFVTLKMAQTLDGKIAGPTGNSRWISSKPARLFVHELRAQHDAILVGKNTALADNPFLSPRIPHPNPLPRGEGKKTRVPLPEGEGWVRGKPWRVVIDPDLELSARARVFEGEQVTVIAIPEKKIRQLSEKASRKKIRAVFLPVKEKAGKLDVRDLLQKLGGMGVAKLLVEGGGELAWSLIKEGLVDRGYWIIAPKILGGRTSKTSVEGEGFDDPDHARPINIEAVRPLGGDWVVEFKLKEHKRTRAQGTS